jgi:hypothetical protein
MYDEEEVPNRKCMHAVEEEVSHGYNSIWIIVDRLTKSACFIPVSTTYKVRQYAELYISHIVRYHGIPKTIISDRGSIFVARLWEQLHECWAPISSEA